MILPKQFVNEVRAGEDIKFCPYCSKVVFYVDDDLESSDEDAEGLMDVFDGDTTGGLADLMGEEEEDLLDDEDPPLVVTTDEDEDDTVTADEAAEDEVVADEAEEPEGLDSDDTEESEEVEGEGGSFEDDAD